MASTAMSSSMVAVSHSIHKACAQTRTNVVANARSLPTLARSTARLSRKSAWTAVRVSKPRHNFIARASRHQVTAADAEVTTEETSSQTTPSERRPRREVTVQQEDVAVGNKYTGTVTSVQSYGAFVNFGAKSDGLVHISELTTGFVESVGDVVTQGQEVEVRVLSVDVQKNRVALSMKEEGASSPAPEGNVEMGEGGRPVRRGKVATRGKREGGPRDNTPPPVKKGEKYMGVVKSLLPFGAFVELKLEGVEGVQGLLHVSEISEERIQDPSSVLSEEQEVEVRVLAINGSKLNLSMREQVNIAELNAAANEDLGETFSVLELALKKAGIKSENFPKGEAKPATAEAAAEAPKQSTPEPKAAEPTPEPEVVKPESKPEAVESVPEPKKEAPKSEEAAPAGVAVSASMVKDLRSMSGAGMMDCKKALQETGGDVELAAEWLRKKGMASADKKASRIAAEGAVGAYIHAGSRIGVLVEVNCETDFVAKGDVFKGIVADVAMQIAACPTVEFVSTDDVPADFVAKEKAIEMGKEDLQSKPENIREKMVEGRIAKLLKEKALLEQSFIKDGDKTVEQFIKENIAAIGEKISIRRFERFNLGEGLEKRTEDFAAEVAAQTQVKESAPKPQKEEPKEDPAKPAVKVDAKSVKELRNISGAGMMDCKKALQEMDGDVEKASEWLRKKGMASADKKASRIAAEGGVGSYIHAGSRIGVLVEVNCETDFVAKGDVFKGILADVAMQIAACPTVEFVSTDDVPADFVAKEKAIEMGKEDLQSKPENIREKMVEGRIAKLLKEKALLEQPYIKDSDKTVEQFIKENIAAIGEKISIRRFQRFNLGEGLEKRNEDFAAEVAAQMGK